MNAGITESIDELIRRGSGVLAGYKERGNIDQHDVWFQAARSFLAVNDPELERRLLSVASKYRDALLAEPYGRAAYMVIQEQLEIVKLARHRLAATVEPRTAATDPAPSWKNDLDKVLEVKPSLFGISINVKEIVKTIFRRRKL